MAIKASTGFETVTPIFLKPFSIVSLMMFPQNLRYAHKGYIKFKGALSESIRVGLSFSMVEDEEDSGGVAGFKLTPSW
jgi:hypothetical protein